MNKTLVIIGLFALSGCATTDIPQHTHTKIEALAAQVYRNCARTGSIVFGKEKIAAMYKACKQEQEKTLTEMNKALEKEDE